MYEVCPCTSLAPLPTFTDATWDRTSRSKIAGSKSRLMIVVARGCFGFNLKFNATSLESVQSDWLWCFQWCRGEGCEKLIGDEEFQIKCTTPAKLIGDEDYAKLLYYIIYIFNECSALVLFSDSSFQSSPTKRWFRLRYHPDKSVSYSWNNKLPSLFVWTTSRWGESWPI